MASPPLLSNLVFGTDSWCIGIENLTIVLRWCSQPGDVPHLGKREPTAVMPKQTFASMSDMSAKLRCQVRFILSITSRRGCWLTVMKPPRGRSKSMISVMTTPINAAMTHIGHLV